ncbi:hypothetical protein ACEWY4_020985 [Coilia grayii]|uniref:arylamine N-acetyltransferase n=1 Tax=Coilia grayii TaxID=363190 RepID=A0ABD1J7N8_9TELE
MDLQEYFQRIGFSGPFERPDLPALQLVHRLHVMTIPYENLSLHSQEQVTMELSQVFSKLVHQRRGGWCCESNLLFSWVLDQMGYTYTILGARVYSHHSQDFSELEEHIIIRVEVAGGSYIADVSFGLADQIWEPLELVSGKEQPQLSGTFCLKEKGDTWLLEKTSRTLFIPNVDFARFNLSRGPVNPVFCFTLEPRQLEDFHATAHFLQTNPKSVYTNKSICSLATPTGYRALVGWVYSEVTFAYQETFDLMEICHITDAEVQDFLREKFGLPIIPNLALKNNKCD